MTASWEEARRCPSDQSPGKIIASRLTSRESGAPIGSKLITLQCENTRCEYHDMPYLVQINPDGTIPEPTMERDKFFPAVAPPSQRVRDQARILEEQIKREQKPGMEIRG